MPKTIKKQEKEIVKKEVKKEEFIKEKAKEEVEKEVEKEVIKEEEKKEEIVEEIIIPKKLFYNNGVPICDYKEIVKDGKVVVDVFLEDGTREYATPEEFKIRISRNNKSQEEENSL